jgi:SHS2 domain-containing protein
MPAPFQHVFEEHTGEVRLRLHAPSQEELFRQAARGLADLMVDRVADLPLTQEQEVEVEGRDAEALLVNWLDELIFLTDTSGVVFPQVDELHLEEGRLVARIRGGVPPSFKTSVKAATFHGLEVQVEEGRASAAVILDV